MPVLAHNTTCMHTVVLAHTMTRPVGDELRCGAAHVGLDNTDIHKQHLVYFERQLSLSTVACCSHNAVEKHTTKRPCLCCKSTCDKRDGRVLPLLSSTTTSVSPVLSRKNCRTSNPERLGDLSQKTAGPRHEHLPLPITIECRNPRENRCIRFGTASTLQERWNGVAIERSSDTSWLATEPPLFRAKLFPYRAPSCLVHIFQVANHLS